MWLYILERKKKYSCSVCHFSYDYAWSLTRHYRACHEMNTTVSRKLPTGDITDAAASEPDNVVSTSGAASIVTSVTTAAFGKAPVPASLATTPSRGIFEEDDLLLSCMAAPAAVIRGVSSASSQCVESMSADGTHLAAPVEQSAVDSRQQPETSARPGSRTNENMSASGSSSSSDNSRHSSPAPKNFHGVTTETVATDANPPTTAAGSGASVSNVEVRHPILTDEEIVSYYCDNPDANGRTYAEQLYAAGYLDLAAAKALANHMTSVKKILSKYSANLIIRRSQVIDDSNSTTDPNTYLLEQLYKQTGQKI